MIYHLPMMLLDGDESIFRPWNFSSYLFIDPVLINEEEEAITANKELPYEILVGMFTIFVIITKLPDIVTLIRQRLNKISSDIIV